MSDPQRFISGNFIASRSDMEIVNGLCGLFLGIMLPLKSFDLSSTPVFAGLLQISSSEWLWAAFFFLWGLGSFAAWAGGMEYRKWMMLVSTMVWGFLFWSVIFVAPKITVAAGLLAAVGAGSVVAFKRMQMFRSHE